MNTRIPVYTDYSLLTESDLKNLNPMLSLHWQGLGLTEILCGGSNPDSPFRLAKDIADSEWVVLPMHWTYYLWNQKARIGEADALAKLALEYGKRLIVWFKGDLVPVIPYENAYVYLPGPIRSQMTPNQIACPVFIDDPEPIWGLGKTLIREKNEIPTIGFCGYGSLSTAKFAWSMLKGLQLTVSSYRGKFDYDAIPIVPATILRNRAIRYLEQDSRIKTDFVVRQEYTPRTHSRDLTQTSSRAATFFSNIYESDYTLCVRGFGNWSYRFYETLACGRIPVLIDTDCVLPLASRIDWRRYCVWVDKSDLGSIGDQIVNFHTSLSSDDFVQLQIDCRRLWQDYLSLQGIPIIVSTMTNSWGQRP